MSKTNVRTATTEDNLAVSMFRLKNFKAVRDSGEIRMNPLTVFIGNNGSGKSSIVEGLETLQMIARDGLDKAMRRWQSFEHIWNRSVSPTTSDASENSQWQTKQMSFELKGNRHIQIRGRITVPVNFRALSEIKVETDANKVSFAREEWETIEETPRRSAKRHSTTHSAFDIVEDTTEGFHPIGERLSPDESVLHYAEPSIHLWQFLRLNPEAMMPSQLETQTSGYLRLAIDGSNIAEYLFDIRDNYPEGPEVLKGIVEAVQFVLPYVEDIQLARTTETGRYAYLKLREQGFEIPSWVFSTGTLRLMALLAVLRHPSPPPLIVIEELENGLDPRTIGLIVEEIRDVVRKGRSQVIITTHSPYLLDLFPLPSIIFVERIDGQPVFSRPEDDESIQKWSQEFAPGHLYTMGRFRATK